VFDSFTGLPLDGRELGPSDVLAPPSVASDAKQFPRPSGDAASQDALNAVEPFQDLRGHFRLCTPRNLKLLTLSTAARQRG
jgi:hypothetical protein